MSAAEHKMNDARVCDGVLRDVNETTTIDLVDLVDFFSVDVARLSRVPPVNRKRRR